MERKINYLILFLFYLFISESGPRVCPEACSISWRPVGRGEERRVLNVMFASTERYYPVNFALLLRDLITY